MTEINTNSTVKNFFTNNWLTLVLIVVLGVGSYIGIRYMTSLSDKDTQIEQLINTQKATLADKEREITALTASYNAQASAISKLNTKYETDISQLRTELQSQIDIIKRSRVQRVQALASNPSTISTAFAERWGLTP
jgi:predicted negative regulator of RcsB-dependent stress response